MRYLSVFIFALSIIGCSGPSSRAPQGVDTSTDTRSDVVAEQDVTQTTDSREVSVPDVGTSDADTSDVDVYETSDGGDSGTSDTSDTQEIDTSRDVTSEDAEQDAGDCECSNADNLCCDGCHFEPEGTKCRETKTSTYCPTGSCGPVYIETTETRYECGPEGTCKDYEEVVERKRCDVEQKCFKTDDDLYYCADDFSC